MFVVTNREVDESKTTPAAFGTKLNPLGANELRLAEAVRTGKKWRVKILPDTVSAQDRKAVGISDSGPVYASRYVSRRLLARINPKRADGLNVSEAAAKGRNLLFFVHGFNNDMEAVLERGHQLEKLYGVEVLAFSWPANGGGVRGMADYKSDKRDAKASTGALDRTLEAMYRMLGEFNEEHLQSIYADAAKRFPLDPEKRGRAISRAAAAGCPFTVNAMFHSMGNYLYKHLLKSSASLGGGLLFDNVILAAADTNNTKHREWVNRIRCRNRVYVAINEKDGALSVSRMKSGEEQLARLGHYPFRLDAEQAIYVQCTGASYVRTSHAYFEGTPVEKNARLRRFFNDVFNGHNGEDRLTYQPATNTYEF